MNMISRRQFLRMSAASAAGMLLGNPLHAMPEPLAKGEYFLIGEGVRGDATLSGTAGYSSQPGSVRIWRQALASAQEIRLPFFPHSFVAHPNAPHRIVTFEKWGRHLAEIDLAGMRVVRITQARPGRRFFGHGAHSGEFIFATQMDDSGQRGIVSVLDGTDHRVVHEFETNGIFPHDCQWLPGSDTLLIVNSRRGGMRHTSPENRSSIVWMDSRSGACLKQLFIDTKEFGYAHMAQSRDGHLVLSGSFDTTDGRSVPLLAVVDPAAAIRALDVAGHGAGHTQGEVLSLYLDENAGDVVATLPNSSSIQVWNYRTGEFQRQLDVGEPRGIAYSTELQAMLVSSAKTKSLVQLTSDYRISRVASGVAGTGSHLFRLAI